jgi:hypothetical protein
MLTAGRSGAPVSTGREGGNAIEQEGAAASPVESVNDGELPVAIIF